MRGSRVKTFRRQLQQGFGHFHLLHHCACALMKKPESAIRWLQAAAEDNLQQDARFVALLSKLKQKWEYYKTIL